MDLTIKDVAAKFLVSEKTVYRWVKESKIPVYRINGQYRFKSSEIESWVLQSKMQPSSVKKKALSPTCNPIKLQDLLERGGIYYKTEGESREAMFTNAVHVLKPGKNFPREAFIGSLLDREKLIPTSLGRGLALPHTRDIQAESLDDEFIALFFLEKPVDYGALDGEPVFCFFLFFATDLKRHHDMMMRIVYFCQRPGFKALLRRQAPRREILAYIAEKEQNLVDSH
jgi:nitrogen PTS system EIIA component